MENNKVISNPLLKLNKIDCIIIIIVNWHNYYYYIISKMGTKYDNLSVENLKLILIRLNDNKSPDREKKLFNVDKIVSVNTRNCVYVGCENPESKTHLHVKFTSPDEHGIICLSVLLDKYCDLFYV